MRRALFAAAVSASVLIARAAPAHGQPADALGKPVPSSDEEALLVDREGIVRYRLISAHDYATPAFARCVARLSSR